MIIISLFSVTSESILLDFIVNSYKVKDIIGHAY